MEILTTAVVIIDMKFLKEELLLLHLLEKSSILLDCLLRKSLSQSLYHAALLRLGVPSQFLTCEKSNESSPLEFLLRSMIYL